MSSMSSWVRFECVEDDACELAFEKADRFAAALAFGLLALEIGASRGMDARLRDRDSVQCLSWRLPPRSSRCRRTRPELASSGATPP